MPNCKFCSEPVIVGTAMHSTCWKAEAEKLAATFCDDYCHWPFVCQDEFDLQENHCDSCALIKLLNLGL